MRNTMENGKVSFKGEKDMKTKYECEVCGQPFNNPIECQTHEANHFTGVEKLKYELIHSRNDICDYCDHSYYVYGCELDCNFDGCTYKNNYADFKPVEPIHNKRRTGGI